MRLCPPALPPPPPVGARPPALFPAQLPDCSLPCPVPNRCALLLTLPDPASRVAARAAGALLDMEGALPATPAQRVRLGVTESKGPRSCKTERGRAQQGGPRAGWPAWAAPGLAWRPAATPSPGQRPLRAKSCPALVLAACRRPHLFRTCPSWVLLVTERTDCPSDAKEADGGPSQRC